jgi:hypothetical protein
MKHKLVLIFDEGHEVLDVPRFLIFNNVVDAEAYLLSTAHIVTIKIEPEDKFFSFKTNAWSGQGKAYWAVDKT